MSTTYPNRITANHTSRGRRRDGRGSGLLHRAHGRAEDRYSTIRCQGPLGLGGGGAEAGAAAERRLAHLPWRREHHHDQARQLPQPGPVYSKDRVIVAARQGNILATAFLSRSKSDSRWHRLLLDMDKESQAKALAALSLSASSNDSDVGSKNKPLDLPIFE